MPVIRSNHLKRAQAEREMAQSSATNVERIIHNKLAELHAAAGNERLGDSDVKGTGL